jgi:hypothetical protein
VARSRTSRLEPSPLRVVSPASSPVDAAEYRCGWETGGARCRLPGTASESRRCAWHVRVGEGAERATWEAFAPWIQWLREHRYCSLWTHYPADTLWRWTRGESETAAAAAGPCLRGSCDVGPGE